ncbi:MAG: T9SS type A sorting domain-containing protein [Bacteroidales bacterium]
MKKLTFILFFLFFVFKVNTFSQNWDGDNGVGNFNYANNWYGDAVPSAGSGKDLVFNLRNNGAQSSIYYDWGWADFRTIQYESTFPVGIPFNGNGNGISVYYKIENRSNYTQTINIPTSFKGTSQEINPLNGDLIMGGAIFNDNNKNFSAFFGTSTRSLILNNYVVGNNNVSFILENSHYGILQINCNMPNLSASSFSGGIKINRGELWFNANSAINGGTITCGNGDANVCKLYINDSDGGTTVTNSITIPESSTNCYIGGLNSSNINTFTSALAISTTKPLHLETLNSGGTTEFSGIISGDGTVTTLGAGTILFSNSNSYTGTTSISSGTLELQGSLSSSAITVESGATLKINGTGVTINALTVNAGGFVEIMPGKSLTINGVLANSGTFTINSDDTGTGSLITNSTVTGNVTVERYVTGWGSATEGWHLLSSPVSNQTFTSFTTGSSGDYDFYLWRETTNEWVNYKAEAGSFGSTFVSGKGYLASYETTATKQFTGILNNNDVPFSLSFTSTSGRKGLNLLGNPFPSGIVWDVMAWKPGNIIISGVAKVLSSSTAAYIDLSSGTTIPAMNGFFVYTTAATTLTIPASAKTHGGTWYKNPNEIQKLTLTAVDIDGQTAQQSNIMIQPESSFDFDLLYDGEFSAFYAPSFYSFVNNFAYSTNAIPYIGENTVIPFQFIKNNGTNFRIDAEGVDQMGQSVMLLDILTGTVTDLSQSNSYSFTATANDDPNRFEIHFGVVGINEPKNENSLIAYVYGDRLYVMNTIGKANLQLFDLQGRLVQSGVLNGTGLQSQSVNLPAGVYVVRVNDEKSVKSIKLVIE